MVVVCVPLSTTDNNCSTWIRDSSGDSSYEVGDNWLELEHILVHLLITHSVSVTNKGQVIECSSVGCSWRFSVESLSSNANIEASNAKNFVFSTLLCSTIHVHGWWTHGWLTHGNISHGTRGAIGLGRWGENEHYRVEKKKKEVTLRGFPHSHMWWR